MSFLDRSPFDVNDPQAQELLVALGNGYPLAQDAYRLLSRIGIAKQDIYFGQPMADVWLSICETATNRGLLRRLVDEAAEDHRVPGYEIFRALAATPIAGRASVASLSDPTLPQLGTPPEESGGSELPASAPAKFTRFRIPLALIALIAVVVSVGAYKIVGNGDAMATGSSPGSAVSLKIYSLGQSGGKLTYIFPPAAAEQAAEFAELARNDAQHQADDSLRGFGWYAGYVRVVLEVTNSSGQEVDILSVRPAHRNRSPMKLGTVIWIPPSGAGPEDNSMWFGLDHSEAIARSGGGTEGDMNDPAFFESRFLGVMPGERKVLTAYFYADSGAVSFDIEVEYRLAGAESSVTETISNHGHPFQVTAWACPQWLRRHNVPADTAEDVGKLRYGSVLKKVASKSGYGWEMHEISSEDYATTCDN